MRKVATVLIAMLLATWVLAESLVTKAGPEIMLEPVEKQQEFFGACAGFMEALSELYDASGKPNLAEHVSNLGGNFWTSALAVKVNETFMTEGMDSTQEAYEIWKNRADSLRDTSKTYVLGMLELEPEDFEEKARATIEVCGSEAEYSNMLNDMMLRVVGQK